MFDLLKLNPFFIKCEGNNATQHLAATGDASLNFLVQAELGQQLGRLIGLVSWRLASSCRIAQGSMAQQDYRKEGKKKENHQEPHFNPTSLLLIKIESLRTL